MTVSAHYTAHQSESQSQRVIDHNWNEETWARYLIVAYLLITASDGKSQKWFKSCEMILHTSRLCAVCSRIQSRSALQNIHVQWGGVCSSTQFYSQCEVRQHNLLGWSITVRFRTISQSKSFHSQFNFYKRWFFRIFYLSLFSVFVDGFHFLLIRFFMGSYI